MAMKYRSLSRNGVETCEVHRRDREERGEKSMVLISLSQILSSLSPPSPVKFMRNGFSAVVLVVFLNCIVLAAHGSLSGRVTTLENEITAPLVGVNVLLQGTIRGTVTNNDGRFRLENIPAGKYSLSFSLVGYRRQSLSDVVVTDDKETVVEVSMWSMPIQAEQVIVTANRREQSLEDVPVSVSVLDATMMRQRNSLTIDDALRYVPGVNMTGPQINIRGSSGYSLGAGSRVLMLLDGVPLLAGDTGELLFESIPVGQIDRIEVVKGASSALYGSNALGGVINIITKPISETTELDVRTYGGLYDKPSSDQWKWSDKSRFFHGQSLALSRKFGDLGVSFFASRQFDDGFRQNDYLRRYNFYTKSRYDFTSSSALTMNFGLLHQYGGQFLYWKNLDSALIPPVRNARDEVMSTRYYVNGLYSLAVSENLLVTGKAMWSHGVWGFQQTGFEKNESVTDGLRAEATAAYVLDDVHTFTLGLQGNADIIRGQIFESRSIAGLALFGQDELKLNDLITVTVGARTDFQSVGLANEGAQVNPKIGVAYKAFPGTTFRASFGKGFRTPAIAEAFIAGGGGTLVGVPNTELRPERSYSYEAGVAQSLGESGSLDVAAFRSDFSDLIEPGLFVFGRNIGVQWRNVTKARVQGAESSLKLGFFDGDVQCNLGYTFVYPEDLTRREILKYRPRHLLYASVSSTAGILSGGVDFRYVSRVDEIDDELVDLGIVPDGDERNAIITADVRVRADFSFIGFPLATTLYVKNLFQHNYVELIGNLRPPRTFGLVLEAKL
jgi:iron complex outermembrane receptor protein